MEKDRLFKAIRARIDERVEDICGDFLQAAGCSGDIAPDELDMWEEAIDTLADIIAGMVETNKIK